MKGYIINPDKEYTQKIIEGIYKKMVIALVEYMQMKQHYVHVTNL